MIQNLLMTLSSATFSALYSKNPGFYGFFKKLTPDLILEKAIHIVIILVLALITQRVVSVVLDRYQALGMRHYDPSKPEKADKGKRLATICDILRNTFNSMILTFVIVILLGEIGLNIAPLIAGAGIAGVAIAFGAQTLVKDLFYGFFNLFEDQFGVGDVVKIGDIQGVVERMSLRNIAVRGQHGQLSIIPASETAKVTIYSRGWSGMVLDVEISAEADLDHVFNVLDMMNEQFYKDNETKMLGAPENVGVDSFGPKGPILRIIAKTPPVYEAEITRLYRKRLKQTFDSQSISLALG